MSKDKTKYTVIRRGLDPLNVTIELHSEEPICAVERVLSGLQLASESLQEELKLCGKHRERREVVQHLLGKLNQFKMEVRRLRKGS